MGTEESSNRLGKVFALILALPLILVLAIAFVGGGDEEDIQKSQGQCEAPAASTVVNVSNSAPENVKLYAKDLEAASNESGIPASYLAAQIEAESNWNPNASSGVAYGLTQFTKSTWDMYGEGDPNNPHDSIKAQGRYMKVLKDMFPGANYDLVFAAYNAGPGAVQSYSGVPPYTETKIYIAKINALQPKYAEYIDQAGVEDKTSEGKPDTKETAETISNTSEPCNNSGNGEVIENGETTGLDDYPYKAMTHCNGDYSWCPSVGTPLGFFPSECVDFAAWRVSQQLGGSETDIRFDNTDPHLGNGNQWFSGWQQMGWAYGSEPKVGAVVWYDSGAGGASAFGHVAIVKEVNNDGTYVEEGYNGNPAPNDHSYYTRTVSNTTPSKFLYVQK